MVNVYLQKDTPFKGENYIGIVITGSEAQRHTGIFYNTGGKDGDYFLHLASHCELRREEPKDRYCWLPLNGFDPDERLTLAIWFNSIWEKNGKEIPYGLKYSNCGYFGKDGVWKASEEGSGLTCATFVLAIFNDFGFPILDASTSYSRESDKTWHTDILKSLQDYGVPPEHIQTQLVFIGQAARYRPEEVAGAASLYDETPIEFDISIKVGEVVLDMMRSLGAMRSA